MTGLRATVLVSVSAAMLAGCDPRPARTPQSDGGSGLPRKAADEPPAQGSVGTTPNAGRQAVPIAEPSPAVSPAGEATSGRD